MGHPQGLEIFGKSILEKCMMSLLNQSGHSRDDGLQMTIKRRKCDIADKFHRVFELPVEGNAKSPVEREKSHSIKVSKKISYELDVPAGNVDPVSKDEAGLKVYEAVVKENIQRRNYFPERNVVGYEPFEGAFRENIHPRKSDHFPVSYVASFEPHDGAQKKNDTFLKSEVVSFEPLDGALTENIERQTNCYEGALKSDVDGFKPFKGALNEGIQRNSPRRCYVIRDFPKGCMKPNHHLDSTMGVQKDLSKLIVESCGSVEKQEIVIVNNHLALSRDIVRRALNSYREELAKLKEDWKRKKEDVYVAAAKILEKQHKCVNTTKCRGVVLGVEIGDRFQFRAELYVIGLHRRFLNGIDYMYDENGRKLATSVVDSGRYENYSSDDVLIYSGEGGNPSVSKPMPMDQKLQGGNEALKNSIGKEVRVIRCYKCPKASIVDVKTMYVYDGLYLVEEFWQEKGKFGKFVYKYRLRRIHGQPKLPRNIGCFPNALAMK